MFITEWSEQQMREKEREGKNEWGGVRALGIPSRGKQTIE